MRARRVLLRVHDQIPGLTAADAAVGAGHRFSQAAYIAPEALNSTHLRNAKAFK